MSNLRSRIDQSILTGESVSVIKHCDAVPDPRYLIGIFIIVIINITLNRGGVKMENQNAPL